MAEILLARAIGIEGFSKLVVIKKILPDLRHDERIVAMFLDEARLAATLHHPNIVQVEDICSDDSTYYLTMEFLHGADVRRLVDALAARGEQLPLEIALHIVSSVLAGLAHAHDRRDLSGRALEIVHRD